MNDRFRLYAFLDLDENIVKSLAVPKGSDAASIDPDYLIKGRFLHAVPDASKETPIIDEMDYSYFDRQGFVKYEHDPVVTTIEKGKKIQMTQVPDPDNIIGAPLGHESVNSKEEHLIVALFPGMEKAQKTVKLMKELRKHNERFPSAKRTMGFSIEGKYTKKSKGHYAGQVYNVVVTPVPQDCTTYAEFAKSQNMEMLKSMAAGYGTSPETQQDGGALREESLEGSTHNKKRKKNMARYRTRQAAYSDFKIKGLAKSETELKKLAEDAWKKQQSEEADELSKDLSAIDKASEKLVKGIEHIATFLGQFGEKAEEISATDVSLKKSIQTMQDGDTDKTVDGAIYLGQVARGVVQSAHLTRMGNEQIMKSLSLLTEGVSAILGFHKSLVEENALLKSNVDSLAEEVASVRIGLANRGGVISKGQGLSLLKPEGADSENVESDPADIINKGLGHLVVEDYLVSRIGVATTSEEKQRYANAHFSFRKSHFSGTGASGLPRDIQMEIIKAHKLIAAPKE